MPQFLLYLTGSVRNQSLSLKWKVAGLRSKARCKSEQISYRQGFRVHNASSLEKIRIGGEIKLQMHEFPRRKDHGGVAVGEIHIKSDPLPSGRDAVNSYSRRQFSSLRWNHQNKQQTATPRQRDFTAYGFLIRGSGVRVTPGAVLECDR
ncbi:MAG: hypothetical protein DME75_04685 [Verrucomicrobia bacterium]|nr:MAG: hypothetical protein DME75_04685 [Verrucomicrobiota bacterium]